MSNDPFAHHRSDNPLTVFKVSNAQPHAATTQSGQAETLSAGRDSNERAGSNYGEFRVERTLGAGGMGVVYVARHRETGQLVAVKVLRQSIAQQRTLTQRFRRELQAIALLEHAHIVPLVASGIELENAFLAMQLIDGVTLTEIIASAKGEGQGSGVDVQSNELEQTTTPVTSLSVVDCAALLASDGDYFKGIAVRAAQIADALQAAHVVGIVHRDVKPSNILLDVHGKAWLTDFGLAAFSDDQTVLTMTGEIVGTPTYMSPEQTLGPDQPVDARSDIYSLGATLYELATLHRPFKGNRDQILFRVMRGDLVAPRVARPEVPMALEAIILKAMALSPNARYSTAAEMSDDLRRFAAGKIVHAKRPGWSERTYACIEKNPLVALASLLGAIATIIAIFAVQAVNSHSLQRMNRILEDTNQFLLKSNDTLSTREGQLQQQLYVSDISAAFKAYGERDFPRVRQLLQRHESETDGSDLRGIAWHLLDGLTKAPEVVELTRHTGPATELAIFPGGGKAVSVGHDGQAHIFELRPQAEVRIIPVGIKLDSIAVSPDGKTLLTGMNIPQGQNNPRRYDVLTGELLSHWDGHSTSIESAAISPDGSLFATASRYDEMQVRGENGEIVHRITTGSRNESLAFFNSNHHIATLVRASGRSDSLKVWDLANERLIDLPFNFDANTFAFTSPKQGESSFLIVAASPERISVARWPDGETVLAEQLVGGRIRCIDISPDGQIIAAGCDEGSVFVWNITNQPKEQPPLPQVIYASDQRITSVKIVTGPTQSNRRLGTQPGGILTASDDGRVCLWSLPRDNPRALFDSINSAPESLALSSWADGADAEKLYLQFADNSIGVLDSELNFRRVSGTSPDQLRKFLATPSGEHVIVATTTELASINLQTGLIAHRVDKHDAVQNCISMLIMGEELFALFNDHIMVLDAETLREKSIHQLPDDDAGQLVHVPGTETIRVVTRQSIHELKHGNLSTVATSTSTAENYDGMTFSQSGKQYAIRYTNGSVRVESSDGQKPSVLLMGHRRGLFDCVFLHDERVLATSSHDRTIRFWDLATSRELGVLDLPISAATSFHYFPTTRTLVTTHSEDPPQVWTLSPHD